MNALEIKIDILKNIGKFGGSFACLEWCYKDVVFVDRNNLLREIEIKISIDDLKNEHKKDKWNKNNHYLNKRMHNRIYIPSYYYFCIIPEMVNKGMEYIQLQFPFAGVYVYDKKHFKSIKRAKRIHNNQITSELLHAITRSYYHKCIRTMRLIDGTFTLSKDIASLSALKYFSARGIK